MGRPGDAWALLDEIRRHRGRPVPPVLAQRIDALAAHLRLIEGDVEAARAHAVRTEDPRRSILLARIHAEANEPELAVATVGALDPRSTWGRIDALLVRARCVRGDDARAEALRDALRIAEPDTYVRVFVDEARWISDPLRELVASWPTGYVADLVTALANEPARAHAGTAAGGLTDREVEVWRYLGTPLSTREIADALFISRNTLKSHLRSIYRKLGVRTRADAVARGIANSSTARQSPRTG
jgi:LuxR family maltose regulon positive regulatory protein